MNTTEQLFSDQQEQEQPLRELALDDNLAPWNHTSPKILEWKIPTEPEYTAKRPRKRQFKIKIHNDTLVDFNRTEKQPLKVQIVTEDFNDKQNGLRMAKELGEERRTKRLQKVVKALNPQRTHSILMQRSRLKHIISQEMDRSKPFRRHTLKQQKSQSLQHSKCYIARLQQQILTLERNNQPLKKNIPSQLHFLPQVTKQLYQKYAIKKNWGSGLKTVW